MGYWRERSRAAIHPNIWFIVETAARYTTLFCVCQSPVLTLPCRLVLRINKGPPASCRRQRRPRQIAPLARSGEITAALMDLGSWRLTHPLPSSHRHALTQTFTNPSTDTHQKAHARGKKTNKNVTTCWVKPVEIQRYTPSNLQFFTSLFIKSTDCF